MSVKKITLDELVLRIIKDYKDNYHDQIRPVDYYLSWYSDMLVIVDRDHGKYLFNYKQYLIKWGLVLGDDRE